VWPDWANFCLLSNCFLGPVFFNLQKRYKFFWPLYPRLKLCINFDQKRLGLWRTFWATFSETHLLTLIVHTCNLYLPYPTYLYLNPLKINWSKRQASNGSHMSARNYFFLLVELCSKKPARSFPFRKIWSLNEVPLRNKFLNSEKFPLLEHFGTNFRLFSLKEMIAFNLIKPELVKEISTFGTFRN
jgi:hypothetical protein